MGFWNLVQRVFRKRRLTIYVQRVANKPTKILFSDVREVPKIRTCIFFSAQLREFGGQN